MSEQSKNSCAKAFGSPSRNKNLKPKKSIWGGGQNDPPILMPSWVKQPIDQKQTYIIFWQILWFNTCLSKSSILHCDICHK